MPGRVYICGSLAYDRIMDFPGRFGDHILPGKVHILNVTFAVNGMVERPGGTAGNIAYGLHLLGEGAVLMATIGHDYQRYFQWLDEQGMTKEGIAVIEDEFTASAYITTDQADNQITAFNPGAMKRPCGYDLAAVAAEGGIVIVAPSNLQDMAHYPEVCRRLGIGFIFDPGQSLTAWEPKALAKAIEGARVLVSNDYEMALIMSRTGLTKADLLARTGAIITTKGEGGSVVSMRDGEAHVAAVKLASPPVDPTGAGDAYRCGLAKGMLQGKSLVECARLGAVMGSFAVEHQGTQTYRFTPQEFQARYQATFG